MNRAPRIGGVLASRLAKNAPTLEKAAKKKYVMTKFVIDEISGVDRGAQEPAVVALMKRSTATTPTGDRSAAPLMKNGRLTTEEDGHSHLFEDTYQSGSTSCAPSSAGNWHDHPYVLEADGSVTIGATLGHTHAALGKRAPAAAPTTITGEAPKAGIAKNTTKETAMDPEQIARLQKSLATSLALIALTVPEIGYAKTLDQDARDAFVAKPAHERLAIVKAAEDADPVVATIAGAPIRKSADPTGAIAALFASQEELRKAATADRIRAEDAELSKRAGELFPHMVGENLVKTATLRAINSIPDEKIRDASIAMLKAGDAAISLSFNRIGAGGVPPGPMAPGGGDPQATGMDAELNKLATERASKESIPFELAYSKNLEDHPRARELYAANERERVAKRMAVH